ncbi:MULTISPECIES: stealth family protein [Microbacterium]|uniref:stealth family protein n=1 Tax=Microbacterium TaxID=33882 RepID=UPI00217CCFC4|nr:MULTISPECIES: stealth family protein [Microbacterium]UWF78757.1 stealth conserved region 3 domain-containing protein [Microbacterium neungamense]WCM55589.1 stealth conserved region 3 domain-containing protein [Microbacterium sp. EF45047]
MTTLSALPRTRHRSTDLIARPDVLLDRGLLHLVHDDVTPWQARIDDLRATADALEAAGIDVMLIRRDRSTPSLVVDAENREAAIHALRAHLPEDPFYVKLKGRPAVPVEDAVAPAGAPSALRVFRPRITPGRTLRYGASLAARVEFWRFGADLVEAPDDNVLTRRLTPASDLSFTEVERYGRVWRTIDGMFDPLPDEFREDVDIVFSWVDGSSTEFQRQRAAQLAAHVVGEGDDGPARYRHVDELRYALRSVHMYAPWIRRIFIATDSPAPRWLAEHPKVTIVRSEEFFADPSVLPTHNSHAVEAQLHRIPGLSEHFLYSNDDMFFGRMLEPELFFAPGGTTKFVESEIRIGAGAPQVERSGHDNGLRVNRALLRERFGRTIVRDLEHCAAPMRRSVLFELEQTFPEEFARTAAARFRSMTDISVTNSLYHYYALFTGRAVPTTRPRVRYVHTTTAGALERVDRLVERSDLDMFCLNDGAETDIPEQLRMRAVRDALERLFPIRAPWEKADAAEDADRASAAISG